MSPAEIVATLSHERAIPYTPTPASEHAQHSSSHFDAANEKLEGLLISSREDLIRVKRNLNELEAEMKCTEQELDMQIWK